MWLQTNVQGLGWRREVCCGSGLGSQIRGGTEVCCGYGLGSQIRGGTEVCCRYGLGSQIRVTVRGSTEVCCRYGLGSHSSRGKDEASCDSFVQCFSHLRDSLEQISHQTVVCNLEDRSLRILVDGNDSLAVFHSC